MEDLYRLRLTGITYNQIETGVYALILEEETSGRRLPIIIGYPEAQAIECKLQEIKTPRPLTHDLMANMLYTFAIDLKSVLIKKLPTGVFAADITLESSGTLRTIDARSSDAIALAIRTGAPIYTTYDVLEESSYLPEERRENTASGERRDSSTDANNSEGSRSSSRSDRRESGSGVPESLSDLSEEKLQKLMQKAVDSENYEEAARIKKELDGRKETPDSTDGTESE